MEVLVLNAQINVFTHKLPSDSCQVHQVQVYRHSKSTYWVCQLLFSYDDAVGSVHATAPDISTAIFMAKEVLIEVAGRERAIALFDFSIDNVPDPTEKEWLRLAKSLSRGESGARRVIFNEED